LIAAFYAGDLYVDVKKRWRGWGLGYFFCMSMIVTMPFVARLSVNLYDYLNNQVFDAIAVLPPLELQHGQLIFNKPSPYFIQNKEGVLLAIIDTTDQVFTLNPSDLALSILIKKDKFAYRLPVFTPFFSEEPTQNTNQIEWVGFDSTIDELFIGTDFVKSFAAQSLKWGIVVLAFSAIGFFLFGFFVILLLALGLMGQVVAATIFSLKIQVSESSRIAAVALTPPLLICFLLLTFSVKFIGMGIFCVALFAMYFSFALLSIRRASQQLSGGHGSVKKQSLINRS
jgi:hypothetical protein